MQRLCVILGCFLLVWSSVCGKSPSFQTYMNPVIPGDHPDPTLTKIGNTFYTSGSSFNPTPKIYRSTDLVHWEVIAQPVSASWSQYGDEPAGGIFGGHMVYHHDSYWHFFGRAYVMYFVKADNPEGPWGSPVRMNTLPERPAFGQDNSIFIDDDGKWYLLTKDGEPNNHLVELGDDGQPTGFILDLTWLNPGPPYPYGWAEGPVMWKYNGYYYYSFAQHLSGAQYVMRSGELTDDESAWTVVGENIFTGTRSNFGTPNHISPVVELDDGTSWCIAHSNYSSSWHAQGRQGLLCEVTYDAQDFPVIQFPSPHAVLAPDLPSSGIPWTVPRSDMFSAVDLKPEWSHLGYTPDNTYSLSDREGWLLLEPYKGDNTVIQNDGEHSYAVITRVDFEPESVTDEAGLWIMNGPETHHAKVFSTLNSEGKNVFAFSFQDTRYEEENTMGSVVWLKLVRNNHMLSGYYSADGMVWNQIGEAIDAHILDTEKPEWNKFTGNQQGLYIEGKAAFFDLYVYKDGYTPILAYCPANQFGTSLRYSTAGYLLDNIHVNDWAMYAGIEFGNADYNKIPDSFNINASSTTTGGRVEVWLDSLDTGDKITECIIGNTGALTTFQTFTSDVKPVTGQHDVYLKFIGTETGNLFRLQSLYFTAEGDTFTSVPDPSNSITPRHFSLEQNCPNPFNPSTLIRFNIPHKSFISLKVFDLLGKEIKELAGKEFLAGAHSVTFDATHLTSGIYFYTLKTQDVIQTKKMFVIR